VFCGGGNVDVDTAIIKQLVGDIDSNGDDQISFEEFKKMMRGILKS